MKNLRLLWWSSSTFFPEASSRKVGLGSPVATSRDEEKEEKFSIYKQLFPTHTKSRKKVLQGGHGDRNLLQELKPNFGRKDWLPFALCR